MTSEPPVWWCGNTLVHSTHSANFNVSRTVLSIACCAVTPTWVADTAWPQTPARAQDRPCRTGTQRAHHDSFLGWVGFLCSSCGARNLIFIWDLKFFYGFLSQFQPDPPPSFLWQLRVRFDGWPPTAIHCALRRATVEPRPNDTLRVHCPLRKNFGDGMTHLLRHIPHRGT